jgi:hypothetical protein
MEDSQIEGWHRHGRKGKEGSDRDRMGVRKGWRTGSKEESMMERKEIEEREEREQNML